MSSTKKINRRVFLAASTAAVTTAFAAETNGGAGGPVVDTAYGKVRGKLINKVNAFQGIPYGASTAGSNRFMPPQKPQAWTGVKDTVEWGAEAPQGPHTEIPEVAATIPKTPVSEDCLRLNVWSTSLSKTAKKPVMVWFHGGGFASGNGSYTMYDGTNMARKRDVVMVTVNHRLNSFGFLYLADIGGAQFANASNCGIVDCVAALEWVHENIANFGGDPNNVTIFGQSGGGGKVATLLAMPSAKGLFHRAIMQSGANLAGFSRADASKSAETLMAKVGAKTAADLQKVPMDQLIQATLTTPGLRLGPVLDGKTLISGPFDPSAPETAANVPLLIGTTEFEITFFPNTKYDPLDDAALRAAVKQSTRASEADADRLIAAYKKGRPGLPNLDYQLVIASDGFRAGVETAAERKAAQPAPVYHYYFTWQSPVSGGKLRSFHTLDIPFAMANVDEAKTMTGTGKDRYALEDRMSAAWANFARTGDPNAKGLPKWPKFDMATRATMVLANECKVVNDPHGEERQVLASLRRG
jgi:para-nitrobenzyl esterase